jgi:inhibitor of KinA sporulation pathway (predicted exonuclease)
MLIPGIKKNLLIVDLEATCWDKGERSPQEMETIEIGALIVNLANRDIVREFNGFIRPMRNPILSNFCKNLTSINQKDVDAADTFPIVFEKFLKWIGDLYKITFSSWGRYDRWQLIQDCDYHRIEYPFKDHFNIKRFFSRAFGGKRYGLSRAVRKCGLQFEGIHHRGIDDVRNIWRVLKKVIEDNDQLSLFDQAPPGIFSDGTSNT